MTTQTQPVLLRRALTAGQVPTADEFTLNTFVINPADGLLFFLDSNGNVQAIPILPGLTSAEKTIASAATVDLSTVYSPNVYVTGTTAITSFGTGKNLRKSLRFAAGLTLTYNAASLITPTGLNIVTAVGDIAEVSSDNNGNWRVRSYSRADGTSLAVPTDVVRSSFAQTLTGTQRRQARQNLRVRSWNIYAISAAITLDATAVGQNHYITNGGFTVTLPDPGTLASGDGMEFTNISTASVVLKAPSSSNSIYYDKNKSGQSMTLLPGASCFLMTDGSGFFAFTSASKDGTPSADIAQVFTSAQKTQLLSNIGAEPTIGYKTAHSGGGNGSDGAAHEIYLSWSGSDLLAQVDNSSLGKFWTASQATASLGQNGYQRLPSGLLFQWGYNNGASDVGINFPVAFNSILYIGASINADQQSGSITYTVICAPNNNSSFNMRKRAITNGGTVQPDNSAAYWLAIGT